MTDTTPARIAPAAREPLTEQITCLVSEELRAFLLGSVEIDGARSEGDVIRSLLTAQMTSWRECAPAEFRGRVAAGRAELARRAAARG